MFACIVLNNWAGLVQGEDARRLELQEQAKRDKAREMAERDAEVCARSLATRDPQPLPASPCLASFSSSPMVGSSTSKVAVVVATELHNMLAAPCCVQIAIIEARKAKEDAVKEKERDKYVKEAQGRLADLSFDFSWN